MNALPLALLGPLGFMELLILLIFAGIVLGGLIYAVTLYRRVDRIDRNSRRP